MPWRARAELPCHSPCHGAARMFSPPPCSAALQVFTLGASVTRGLGATRPEHNYANRFFSIINATFPHK